MCLMLYIGTAEDLPVRSSKDLTVEELLANRQSVTQWFSQPVVRFVGAHTGCSCGFPSVISDSPIEYYEGMPLQSDDRAADLRSVRALIELLGRISAASSPVELYPLADGDEAKPPKGVIELRLAEIDPERFFFNERFMHVVQSVSPRG